MVNKNTCCKHKSLHRATQSGRPSDTSQIKNPEFEWDYGKESFQCMLNAMAENMERVISSIEGAKLFFSIRAIGSKFRSVQGMNTKLSELVYEYLAPMNFENFFKADGPRAYLDISWKFIPTDPLESTKVRQTNELSQILSNFLVGSLLGWRFFP